MIKNLFIFNSNFKKFILGIICGLILMLFASLIINQFIEKSNFRLSRIFSENKLENYNIFFIGNSRSVSFNKKILENNKVFNGSYNSLNFLEVQDILYALEKKSLNKAKIYIELTSLIDSSLECRFTIFMNLKNYPKKNKLKEHCKIRATLKKFLPILHVKNEIFLRIVYYTFYKNEDQLWQNNYIMPDKICTDGNLSSFAKKIITEDSQNKMIARAKKILKKYDDLDIKFLITPLFNKKKNYSLNIENKFKQLLDEKNLFLINDKLSSTFYLDCSMFADNLHLSNRGIKAIKFK